MVISVRKIIVTHLLLFLTFCQPLIIYAAIENINVKNEAINPGTFYYSFKRLWEKGVQILQFSSESKINFHESLFKKRFAELNYVARNKLLSEVQTSSERFAYEAGILTEELISKNKIDDKKALIKQFEQYGKFLPDLRDKYPANSSYWMLIQHDINTLNILSDRLK